MLKINNIKYNKFETKISWETFSVTTNGRSKTGISPFIAFNVDNILIGLELTFSKEMFESIEIGIKTDIKKYISDITYEDNHGWISIIDGEYDCSVIRKSANIFHINFHVIANDSNDEYDIVIDDELTLL